MNQQVRIQIQNQLMKSSKNNKNQPINSKPTPAQSRISQATSLGTMGLKKQQNFPTTKNKHYLHLTNEQYLTRNLKLLNITDQQFQKQTKITLNQSDKLFPKSLVNPTASKQFFYITYICLKNICCKNEEEIASLAMWYPPRTVNEQLQFKKALFKVLTNLQILGKIPKNLLVSKGTIMGDSSSGTLVEFLRILSQIALRAQYIEKFSKRQRLIQIACVPNEPNKPQNDINRFYVYPFVPNSITLCQPPNTVNIQAMKNTLKNYIKIYLRKLTQLRTAKINNNEKLHEDHQTVMKNLMEQKQLNQTLSQKIPKKLLSENRAFDRRRIIDKNGEIWSDLEKIECNYVEKSSVPLLKVEGEINQLLKKWEPVKGIGNIIEANTLMSENFSKIKAKVDQELKEFKKLKQKVSQTLILS